MSELNIPESWAEVRFQEAIEIQGGSQPPKSEFIHEPRKGYVRLIQIRDFRTDDHPVYIPISKSKRSFTKDDIMIGRYGPPVFQILRGKEGSYNVALMKASPTTLLDKEFMYWFLNNPKIYADVNAVAQRSAGQTGVNLAFLNEYPVPIPPIQEQERIVLKIESCFSKIDETEQNLNKVEILLDKYRESLLAKAFRGELIPQNPDDEPASVLLTKIREERSQNQKGIKKEQEFSPISDDEKPFDIPEGWEAIKLGELAAFIDYRGKTPNKINAGIKLITAKNVRMGYIKNDPEEFISEKDYIGWMTRGFPGTNDLLITTEAPMGNVAITPIGFKFALAQRIINLKINENVNAKFLMYLIMFKDFQRHLDKLGTGATVKGIKASVLKNIYIYFPSINTQNRIADSLDKSFALIEVIRRNVVKNKTLLNQYKEALLIKAFEGRLVEQIESEGSGHELLQKILEQKAQKISVKENTKKKNVKKVSKKK